MHEVDLAAPFEFRADRSTDHVLIELDDMRLNRQPIAWRRLDHRHVANAGE